MSHPTADQLARNEAALQQGLEQFGVDLGAVLASTAARLEQESLGAFGEATTAWRARHAELLDVLESGLAHVEASARWQSAVDYVRSVGREIVAPAAEHIGGDVPFGVMVQVFIETREQVTAAAGRLPGTIEVRLDDALFTLEPDDSTRRRLGKTWSRLQGGMGRALRGAGRLLGGGDSTPPIRIRHLEPRSLAIRRAAVSLTPALRAAEGAITREAARCTALLEHAIETWSGSVLPALSDADHPAWHSQAPAPQDTPDFSDLQAAARQLQSELGNIEPVDSVSGEVLPILLADRLREALEVDFREGGTFLSRKPNRAIELPGPPASASAWTGWFEAAGNRIRLHADLVALRTRLDHRQREMLQRLQKGVIGPVDAVFSRIKDRLSALDQSARDQSAAGSHIAVVQAWDAALADARRDLDSLFRDLSGLASADEALTQPGQSLWQDIMRAAARLQSAALVHPASRDPHPDARTYEIHVQERAMEAFDRPLPSRMKPAAEPLRRAVAQLWTQAGQVTQVVETAFSTAEVVLDDDQEGAGSVAEALRMIHEGLARASASLGDQRASLNGPWTALAERLHRLLAEDWASFYRSVRAEAVLAQRWFGARARLGRSLEHLARRVQSFGERGLDRARALTRLLGRRTSEVVRLGRSAVGVEEVTPQQRAQTADSVLEASDRFASLPLVYRRLFTLDPIADSGLVVNRKEDISDVKVAVERWSGGHRAGVFVVHAPPGAGLTTTLNAVEHAFVDEPIKVRRVAMARRPATEAEIATALATALFPGQSAPADLDGLEQRMQAQKREDLLSMVLFDDAHLMMEVRPDGLVLLERLLLMAARTDDSYFWCFGMNDLAWQHLKNAYPARADLAEPLELTRWTRESIREMVQLRHRRSGIPLLFATPDDPAPIMRQRIRRARSEESRQDLLRDDFFDGLTRDAGQSPVRALFEWVRSLDFESRNDAIIVRPFQPLSYRFLQSTRAEHAFGLRAILVHRALSSQDYARLFRLPPATAAAHLEALLGLGLIEPLDPTKPRRYVVPDAQYRIRRLLVAPVRRLLEERHFVY